MIKRITLHDFMAHEETGLELAPGLNVLTGPNNSGKSAVVAAIAAASSDESGASYVVRHGAREARVDIVVEDDDAREHTIIWTRSKKSSSIAVDGVVSHRGELVVEGISYTDILRLNPAVIRSEDGNASKSANQVDVHFGSQKQPIFDALTDPKVAAALFASMGDAIYIERMKARHREQVSDARRQVRQLDKDLGQLRQDLAVLAPVEGLVDLVENLQHEERELERCTNLTLRLDRTIADIVNAGAESAYRHEMARVLGSVRQPPLWEPIDALEDVISQIEGAISWTAHQDQRCKSLQGLAAPPSIASTVPIETIIADMLSAESQCERAQNRHGVLQALRPQVQLESTDGIEAVIQQYAALQRRVKLIEAKRQVLGTLANAPEYLPVEHLEQLIADYEQSQERHTVVQDRIEALAGLATIPEQQDTSALIALVAQCEHAESLVGKLTREVDHLQENLQQARTELESWIAVNPTCPLCGASLDSERLTGGDHQHDVQ